MNIKAMAWDKTTSSFNVPVTILSFIFAEKQGVLAICQQGTSITWWNINDLTIRF